MPGGKGNITPEDGAATRWKPGQSGNPKGRQVSIKRQLKDLLVKDGAITIPAKQVVKVLDNGDVQIKLPTQQQLAMKLVSWAMSQKGNDSIKAIQMIIDHIDGKAVQPIDLTETKQLIIGMRVI